MQRERKRKRSAKLIWKVKKTKIDCIWSYYDLLIILILISKHFFISFYFRTWKTINWRKNLVEKLEIFKKSEYNLQKDEFEVKTLY